MDRGHDRLPDRDQTVDPTVRRFAVPPLAHSLGAPGIVAHRQLHCRLLHRIVSRSLTLLATTLARAGGMAPLATLGLRSSPMTAQSRAFRIARGRCWAVIQCSALGMLHIAIVQLIEPLQ